MTRHRPLVLAFVLGCGSAGTGSSDASPDAAFDLGPAADASNDLGGDDQGTDDQGTDAGEPCAPADFPTLAAVDVAPGHTFAQPVYVTAAPGDPDTLYVVEKEGRIVVVQDGAVRDTPFFDVRGEVLTDSEQGLLGLAFHPDYASNGRFFVFLTPGEPRRNVVAEYARDPEAPFQALPDEVERLMEVEDSRPNHNGGMLAFGPDGFLFVAMGDEGGAGDRFGTVGNGLDRTTLFGALLRLDVDAAPTFAAAGNPFTLPEGQPQVWAYGLRNPWRFSFDRVTGDLWIGDVGQNAFEEIDFLPAGAPAGANFGWRAYEGFSVFNAGNTDLAVDRVDPLLVYAHGESDQPIGPGVSITGGYVYRGEAIPALEGLYLYGDFRSDQIAGVRRCEGAVVQHERFPELSAGGDGRATGLASFGEDGRGELYVAYLVQGRVRRIVAAE
ncbi:MAG: PQQ-dependent sugar dehydrogenase [Myxococcota bacterium]